MGRNKRLTRRAFVTLTAGGIGLLAHPGFASPSSFPPSVGSDLDAVAIGHKEREDDLPSIAAAPDGSAWASWLSFNGQRDDVAIRRFVDNAWQNIQWVPATSGDSWLPQVAVDRSNRVWVIWSQQLDGSWNVHSRRFDPKTQRWDNTVKLSSGGLADINPRVWSDGQGKAAVVWQGFRRRGEGASSSIFLRVLEDDNWSPEIRVTDQPGNDWDPAVALDSSGTAWVVYDSYRNGNYDVFLAQVSHKQVEQAAIPVAVTPRFEARATIAADTRDRVWVAWEAGHPNWGKDRGAMLAKVDKNVPKGTPLGGFREPQIACYDRGQWLEPVAPLASAFRGSNTYQPHVFSDGAGSVWVVAMMRKTGVPKPASHKLAYWEYWAKAPFGYWDYSITHLSGDRWTEPLALPSSKRKIQHSHECDAGVRSPAAPCLADG